MHSQVLTFADVAEVVKLEYMCHVELIFACVGDVIFALVPGCV
jgi:hypothetical protein